MGFRTNRVEVRKGHRRGWSHHWQSGFAQLSTVGSVTPVNKVKWTASVLAGCIPPPAPMPPFHCRCAVLMPLSQFYCLILFVPCRSLSTRFQALYCTVCRIVVTRVLRPRGTGVIRSVTCIDAQHITRVPARTYLSNDVVLVTVCFLQYVHMCQYTAHTSISWRVKYSTALHYLPQLVS